MCQQAHRKTLCWSWFHWSTVKPTKHFQLSSQIRQNMKLMLEIKTNTTFSFFHECTQSSHSVPSFPPLVFCTSLCSVMCLQSCVVSHACRWGWWCNQSCRNPAERFCWVDVAHWPAASSPNTHTYTHTNQKWIKHSIQRFQTKNSEMEWSDL